MHIYLLKGTLCSKHAKTCKTNDKKNCTKKNNKTKQKPLLHLQKDVFFLFSFYYFSFFSYAIQRYLINAHYEQPFLIFFPKEPREKKQKHNDKKEKDIYFSF